MAFPSRYLGTQLDRRYRIDRWIGEGGSSWVFAAHDLRLDRAVAVKVWKASVITPGADQRRFVEEGRTLAKLVHPHVVAVYDAGETSDGLAYLVMELSDGATLDGELMQRGGLPPGEVVNGLLPLLGAMACAHDLGIVHRDIKPANIVLTRQHGERRAKLLDFGIAKRGDVHSSGLALGTPAYMAPEQARGEPLTAAADVWAMGVVFFRALSGALPFDADNAASLLLKITQEAAPRFASACPDLGPRLAVVLDRALSRLAAHRYQTMRDFARAIVEASVLDGLVLLRQPDPIGLPDFEAWFTSASTEETRALAPGEQVILNDASALRPQRLGTVRMRRALWACAAAALLSALIIGASVLSQPAHSIGERRQQSAKHRQASAGTAAHAILPSPPAVSLIPTHAIIPAEPSAAQPIPSKLSSTRRRAKPSGARSEPSLITREGELDPQARKVPGPPGGIVMTWDW